MKGKTCCVTGHRDLPQNEINKVKAALEHEIDAAVTDGFTCFMSGFADGADQYFAELVLERKQTNPALELIAVLPYRKRLDNYLFGSACRTGGTWDAFRYCHETDRTDPVGKLQPGSAEHLYAGKL